MMRLTRTKKVIPGDDCPFVVRRLSSLFIVLCLCVGVTVCAKSDVDRECKGIGNGFRSKNFTYPWWNSTATPPPTADGQEGSSGCPVPNVGPGIARSIKCCKSFDTLIARQEMSQAFSVKWLGSKLQAQAEVFSERKNRFDLTFKALLQRAHSSFDAMFQKTYGMLYIQHSHVFHELFKTFENYYDSGRYSLDTKLNEFFAILTRKMFEVLNSQYEFDERYLTCAAGVIRDKQGNDLHRQIVSSLRRSFVATRALAQGLQDGHQVLTSLQKLQATPDCLLSLSQMLHCPVCLEQRPYKPCIQVCTKVTTGCVSATASMTRPWTDFTTAIEGIIDRLLGPYNVEAVVEPIHIKISEAIMNFQESGPDLSQAVFANCGKPDLKSRGLRKREAYDPSSAEPPKTAEVKSKHGGGRGRDKDRSRDNKDNEKSGGGVGGGESDMQPSKSLEKLLRETKKRIQKTKNLWEKLPQQVCNGISKSYSSKMCWNGTSIVPPTDRNKSGEENEVKPSAASQGGSRGGSPNELVAEQILVLQLITDKLRASYNGQDVQWVPEIEDMEFGSGQGSGSGDIPTDMEESEDDNPDGSVSRKRPSYPSFPRGPPPPLFDRLPNHPDHDDDDNDDGNEGDNQVRPISFDGTGGVRGGGMKLPSNPIPIDTSINRPRNNNNDHNKGGNTPVTPNLTTSKRPPYTPSKTDDDVNSKKVPTSAGTMDAATKTVAVFKLFTPIFVSMLGKLVSLS